MLRLTVTGEASTQLLLRAINLLAQRGLMPHRVAARSRDGRMRIRIDLDAEEGPATDTIIEKLRSLVEVAEVVANRSTAHREPSETD